MFLRKDSLAMSKMMIFRQTMFKQDAGRNGSMKATMSQKPRTDKAKTNKDNITINWRAEGNTIRKNSE